MGYHGGSSWEYHGIPNTNWVNKCCLTVFTTYGMQVNFSLIPQATGMILHNTSCLFNYHGKQVPRIPTRWRPRSLAKLVSDQTNFLVGFMVILTLVRWVNINQQTYVRLGASACSLFHVSRGFSSRSSRTSTKLILDLHYRVICDINEHQRL